MLLLATVHSHLCDPSNLGGGDQPDFGDRLWFVQSILLHSDWSSRIQILSSKRQLLIMTLFERFAGNNHATPFSKGVVFNSHVSPLPEEVACTWPMQPHFRWIDANPLQEWVAYKPLATPISEGLWVAPVQPHKSPFQRGLCTSLVQPHTITIS